MTPRTVVVLVYGGCQLLDIAGPAEVFGVANGMVDGAYRIAVASREGRDVVSSCGLRIGVHARLADLDGPIDTLLVPGGPTWTAALEDDPLLDALREAAARSRRVAGICAGAFPLAAVGLLDGRRATTHWQFQDELAERFPEVALERDPIFVGDDGVYTSAGASAGIDLALAMVEEDLGPGIARSVAAHLVVFMQRPANQAQFSVRLRTQPPLRSSLRPLLDAIAADPAGDHRLPALAARAGFSERHLARVFARELGTTPARYVEQVRVEAARALLEGSDTPLETVARTCGLRSAETLRRVFLRELAMTPHAYRQRLAPAGRLVR